MSALNIVMIGVVGVWLVGSLIVWGIEALLSKRGTAQCRCPKCGGRMDGIRREYYNADIPSMWVYHCQICKHEGFEEDIWHDWRLGKGGGKGMNL